MSPRSSPTGSPRWVVWAIATLLVAASSSDASPSHALDHSLALRYTGSWQVAAAWRAAPNATEADLCAALRRSDSVLPAMAAELCVEAENNAIDATHPFEPVDVNTRNETAFTPILRGNSGLFRSWWHVGYSSDRVDAAGSLLVSVMWDVGSANAEARRVGFRIARHNQSLDPSDAPSVANGFVAFGPSRDASVDISAVPHRVRPMDVAVARENFFKALNRSGSYEATRRRALVIATRSMRQTSSGMSGFVLGKLFKSMTQIDDFKDCASFAFATSEPPRNSLARNADAADDAIDAGTAHLAPSVNVSLLVLCNASDSAEITQRLTSGNITSKDITSAVQSKQSEEQTSEAFRALLDAANRTGTVAVLLQLTSNAEGRDQIRRAVWVFLGCSLTAVALALDALLPLAKVAPTSVGQMGRVSYGFVASEGFLWAVSLSAIGGIGSGSIVSRQILLVDGAAQVLVNIVGMKLFFYVRRAHTQLELDTFARRGAGAHFLVIFAVVLLAGVLDTYIRSLPIVMLANSGVAMQVYHSLRFREDPGFPTANAAKLSAARLIFLAPFFVPNTDDSMFWIPPARGTFLVLALWMAFQVALLRKDVRRACVRRLPASWRPTVHYYGVPESEIRKLVAAASEHDCQICKLELIEDDAETSQSPPPPPPGTVGVTVETDDTEIWRTPCGHLFHRDCLRRWMEERMVCPLCRTKLPKPESAE